ncbi:MAG: CheR family methyltransferase [Kofleriaceae bacterium]
MNTLVRHTLDEIARVSGLAFADVRLAGAVEMIEAWIAAHGFHDPSEVASDRSLAELIEDLVVHESYFDRDLDQLRAIDELVLDGLARAGHRVRVWSAGCAGGEEPYTLAFMLDRRGMLPRAQILATDLSRAALARARTGVYRGWSVRTGATTPAMRHLKRDGTALRVPEAIRSAVVFAPLNLVTDAYPQDQHLVVCRNVLIYLQPTAIATVARKLAAALAPEGWLFVAPSDPRLDPHAGLVATVTDRGVHYRRGDRAPERVRHRAPITLQVAVAPPPPPVRVLPPAPKPALAPAAPALPSPAERARRLADRGDFAGARTELAAAIVAAPLDPELYFLTAVLAADDDAGEALAALDRAIYLAPESPISYLFAGRLHQSRGDARAARRAYRAALPILDAFPPDARVPWSDETARVMATACRQAMEHLDG